MDTFQEEKSEFKPKDFFEQTENLLNKNFSGFQLEISIKNRRDQEVVTGDTMRVEWMLNKLVKNCINRTFNAREKKISVHMYYADWQWESATDEAVSLETEK